MQAVILAAGQGLRLRPLTEKLPKGLIEIGGKTLLEHSLDALKENGIKEVIIVIGFLGQAIKQRFGMDYKGTRIKYVSNNEYATTGSMYSLFKAKATLGNNDVILLESDLLYDPKAIEIALNAKYKDVILVSDLSNSGDEVYICIDEEGRITKLGKNIPNESKKNAVGELVGICRFSREFIVKLFRKAEKEYSQGKLNYEYEECAFITSQLGNPLYAVLCDNLVWIEIDNENDFKKAKERIYPMLELPIKQSLKENNA